MAVGGRGGGFFSSRDIFLWLRTMVVKHGVVGAGDEMAGNF